MQASESQVYLSFYSEHSQGSSPRSGVKVESCESYFDKAASKRVCGSLLTHKASESRFNVVNTGSDRSRVEPLSHSVTVNSSLDPSVLTDSQLLPCFRGGAAGGGVTGEQSRCRRQRGTLCSLGRTHRYRPYSICTISGTHKGWPYGVVLFWADTPVPPLRCCSL